MINVYMLAEELGGTVVRSGKGSLERLDLETARLWSRFSRDQRADCLFVVAADELAEAAELSPYLTFAVVGAAPPDTWDGRRDLLVLPDEHDALDALDHVLSVFERFNRTEAAMAHRAIAGRDATAILEPCTELLNNPIVLADLAFGYLARTGVYDPERTDVAWDEVESQGYAVTLPMTDEQLRRLKSSHGPLRYELRGVSVLQACVRCNGEAVGFIGSTELYGPFTDGQAAITWWVTEEVGALWPLIIRNVRTDIKVDQDLAEQTVLRTIEGKPVGRGVAERMLSRRSWKIDDRYRILCLSRAGRDLDEGEVGIACRSLASVFPRAIVMAYDGTVLVVLHGGDVECDLASDAVRTAMERDGLRCAVSTVEDDFEHLDRLWEQCRIVRDVTDASDMPAGTVTAFHEALPTYLLDLIGESLDMDALVHPQVASLARRPRGEDFVHSLRVYLACGRSKSRAARELYVHRSTLDYRVEQIEGELGFPLDEADEDMLVHLYLSCVILERDGEKAK